MIASRPSKRLLSTAKMTTAVSEIPSIASLYRHKQLHPSTEEFIHAAAPSQVLNNKIGLFCGDITTLPVDAIVNAANASLRGGGGVDGVIHRAAGPGLLAECRSIGGCDTGDAKITDAYNLPCKKVIHAVGPVYKSSMPRQSASYLAACYTASLRLAAENDCKSIAFSCLSTGIYGYPSQDAAQVAIKAVYNFLRGPDRDKIERVIFCTFEMKDVRAYNNWIPFYFPPTKQDLKGDDKTGDQGEESKNIQGGKSVDNGVLEAPSVARATVEDLPEVPTTEPSTENGPVLKKRKSSHD